MKFLFTCGGTAGHINPALAVAGKIRELMPDSEFLFVGAAGNMETELVPREGFPIVTIPVSGLSRGISPRKMLKNGKTVIHLLQASSKSKAILKEFCPDAALGTGGYVCYPVLKAASRMGIPTAVHESNAVPGLTTKMLSGTVSRILVGFEDSKRYYKNPEKVLVTGTPVRGAFFAYTRKQARTELGIPEDKPLVLSLWGSLGASHMNEIMVDFIAQNARQESFYHIHATGNGEAGRKRMGDMLKQRGVLGEAEKGIDIRPYIFDMPRVMVAADLVLCRAGASTLAELTALGRPAILIPSPNVTNNHQEKNARLIERAGGGKVILEEGLNGKILFDTVEALIRNPPSLQKMAECAKTLGTEKSTEKIVEVLLGHMR